MVESETQQLFRSPKEVEEVRTCISSLSRVGFRSLLMGAMTRIAGLFEGEVERLVRVHFMPTSYKLSEEEFGGNGEEDPFVRGFCDDLSEVLAPFHEGFTDTNFEEFIHTLMKGLIF